MSFLVSFQPPTRSVGQANFFSKTSQSINSKGTSIVWRLASRCVTGNGLRIQIHQHIGFRLHIVWNVTDFKATRCLERVFTNYGELLDFCIQLKIGAFEGLCDCVCTHFIEWMEDKIKPCLLEYSTQSQIRQSYVLRFWESTEEEENRRRNFFQCMCPVSSSYDVGELFKM